MPVTAKDYAKRWFLQVLGQIVFESGLRGLAVYCFLGVAILVLQLANHVVPVRDFRGNVLSILWPYLAAAFLYVVFQIVRAPLVLDRQRAQTIEDLEKRIPGASVEIAPDQLTFEQKPSPDLHVRLNLHIRVRTGDFPATLQGWKLHSQLEPTLNPLLIGVVGIGKHVGGLSVRLDSHDRGEGFVKFDFLGEARSSIEEICDARHRWTLSVSDAHQEYRLPIPYSAFADARPKS